MITPQWTTGLLVLLACGPAAGGNIHHWIDAQGQSHYSDRAPHNTTHSARRIPIDRRSPDAGLRAGERSTLRQIERRQRQQHKIAERRRHKNRQAREAHRKTCRDHRQRQRLGRRHADGKALSRFLREHCW